MGNDSYAQGSYLESPWILLWHFPGLEKGYEPCMRDDIRLAEITTKPRFESANFKFYHELIPKAAKMKRTPT